MDSKNVFSRNLQYQMDLHSKSRQEVSTALGISYFTITSWVNGTKFPRMDKVEMLAKYFGCKKSDLIEEKKTTETEVDSLSKDRVELINRIKALPEDKVQLLLQLAKSIE